MFLFKVLLVNIVLKEFLDAAQEKIETTSDPYVSGALNDLTEDVRVELARNCISEDFRRDFSDVTAANLKETIEGFWMPLSLNFDPPAVPAWKRAQELLLECIPGDNL